MSKVFTGYYAKGKTYQEKGLLPISISRYANRFFKCVAYRDLAPTPDMLKMETEEYIPKFEAILADLDPQKVFQDLMKMSDNQPVVLLCFEKPSDFCHRQLVAAWFRENGIDCQEFDTKTQAKLF